MNGKVTHIYAIDKTYNDGFELVEMPVVRETEKLYWIPSQSHSVFNWRQKVYKDEALVTKEQAIEKYRQGLVDQVRYASHTLSNANDALDTFNHTVKEGLL